MKRIKLTVIILCLALLVSATACQGDADAPSDDADGSINATIPQSDEFTGPGIDTIAAMGLFSPDTVMLSAGDLTITWGYFYFLLHDTVASFTNGFEFDTDWHEETPEGVLSDLVLEYVIEEATRTLVYNYGVQVMGITISDDDSDFYQEVLDSMVTDAGGLSELEEELRAEGFSDFDVYQEAFREFTLQEHLRYELFDTLLAETDDSTIISYAEDEGFMSAKHVLIMFPDESEFETTQEFEENKQTALEKINDILQDLEVRKDDEDFVEYFTQVMIEQGEDPGTIPNGYLFRYNDMVEPFSEAATQLEPGEMSGIVETLYGYHIILKLPLDIDNMTPIEYASYGQEVSLRQIVVSEAFGRQFDQWLEDLDIVRSPQLESLDLSVLFAWQD